MTTLVDSRLVNLDWVVTEAVTAVTVLSFEDAAGDPQPVDSWSFTARVLRRPGSPVDAVALAVDTSQAAAGQVTVTADDAASVALGRGQWVWSLVWTVAGEPAGGVGGRFTVMPEGARGAQGVLVAS